ncbi:MAG: YitT family protein [Parafannyhessea sp.]|uniref:YitT family protein n=1 Tax=Parafannyhessea sp. TaxID=2847324 RepID=UPI003F012A81
MRLATDWRRLVRDALLIVGGSVLFAIGIDCFELPNGIAAGGLTGLATIIYAVGKSAGVTLPVGLQTIVMNIVLLAYVVVTTRDWSYVSRSIAGILVSGFLMDALKPFLPVPTQGELLISAIWGAVFVGAGVGVVFLSGGNTGGTDIVCQLIAKRNGMPLGTLSMIVDGVIVVASIPVFSLRNALFAGVAMYIGGRVIDAVVDGPRTARVAYVISDEHEAIANRIMYELGRGCTELQARGVWSGNDRPVLMCVCGRTETTRLKQIVGETDPDAIVILSEVHEAFGEGFSRIGA